MRNKMYKAVMNVIREKMINDFEDLLQILYSEREINTFSDGFGQVQGALSMMLFMDVINETEHDYIKEACAVILAR